jgi:hypothetical protein
MALQAATSFNELRDALCNKLMSYACIPNVENVVITSQLERRFFPTGTAERILDPKTLDRLFALAALHMGMVGEGSWPAHLGQIADNRKLHIFLAILIISRCDAHAFASVVRRLVLPTEWNDSHRELVKLPVVDSGSLQQLCGDRVSETFMSRQHEFLAPVIEEKTEIRGQFRRLPYIKEKVIGQGSFGKVYEVEVRSTYSRLLSQSNIATY